MYLTSDVKQLIQRSQWEVNTIEPRKIIARKQRKTSQVFTSRMTQHCGDQHLSILSAFIESQKSDWGTAGPTPGVQFKEMTVLWKCPLRENGLYLLNWMRGNLISRCLGNRGLKHPYYTTNMNITILIWSHPTRLGSVFTRCECITWFTLVGSLSLIVSCTLGMRRNEAKKFCFVSHLQLFW